MQPMTRDDIARGSEDVVCANDVTVIIPGDSVLIALVN